MRLVPVALLSLALLAPFGHAGGPVSVGADATFGPAEGGLDAVNYEHRDCVGPGVGPVAGPHATHTTRVSGFVIDPARRVTFGVSALSLFGTGPCPAAIPGTVLPEDFTGSWHLTAVCRGTLNDGTILVNWRVDFVAGIPLAQSFAGFSCVGYLGTAFALDVTVGISSTDVLLGVPIDAVGGVKHSITQ